MSKGSGIATSLTADCLCACTLHAQTQKDMHEHTGTQTLKPNSVRSVTALQSLTKALADLPHVHLYMSCCTLGQGVIAICTTASEESYPDTKAEGYLFDTNLQF